MKACHLCGNDLSKWSLDETRLLECGLCVQRALMKLDPASQIPIERPEKPVAGRTVRVGITYHGQKIDRVKNPIKWGDGLL